MQKAVYCPFPTCNFVFTQALFQLWLEALIPFPTLGKLFRRWDQPGLQPRKIGSAERGGFHYPWPIHCRVENVGKCLHGPLGGGHAAIYPQHGVFQFWPIAFHGFDQIESLKTYGFKCRTSEFLARGTPGQAKDGAARISLPVRCSKP